MMFFKRKKQMVECKISVLFEIVSEDLKKGLCTDVIFMTNGKKHHFGTFGDSGNTYKNVLYFLDEFEYNSMEELKENAKLNGVPLGESRETITVLECNGCYPDSTPQLAVFLK